MLLNEVIENNVIDFLVNFQATRFKDKVFHPSQMFTHDFDQDF